MNNQQPRVMMSVTVACATLLMSGCVVLEEKYNAEKTRSLNFQRLLAQEEKRTAELDSEVKRTKKELVEFEARNRELSAQVQSAREQMGRLQEETDAIREAALLERKAMSDLQKQPAKGKRQPEMPAAMPRDLEHLPTDMPTDLGGLSMPRMESPKAEAKAAPTAGTHLHIVKPGETLFRISKRYGVPIDLLKKWNRLPDDIIEVGQKLIVSAE